MTLIGKLLVFSILVMGLSVLTWSASVYVQRPGWFDDPQEAAPKGHKPVTFKGMKAEAEALYRNAAVASESWGTHLKVLEEREKLRADRRAAYAERLRWAHKGNPNDLIDKANPKLGGKGFYESVVDKGTNLYDMTVVAGLPKGKAVLGTGGAYLPGRDGLLDSIAGDTAAGVELNKQILALEDEFDKLDKQVRDTEVRAIKMGEIRDQVQAELFFLSTFEVNVFETRETVFRRERQLRARLKILGINDP
jgi:hypothetical protein